MLNGGTSLKRYLYGTDSLSLITAAALPDIVLICSNLV